MRVVDDLPNMLVTRHYKCVLGILEQCMQFIRSQKMNLTKYLVPNFYGPKMWILFLFIWLFIVGTQFATATSQIQMEANAMLNSGWWNTSDSLFNSSNPCDWVWILCNEDGTIN